MYFYIKPINNNTYYNSDTLSVIKNLQSLGIKPTGRPTYDRQQLQIAEYEKLKATLKTSDEQKIQNAQVSFDNMMQETTAGNYAPVEKADQEAKKQVSTALSNQLGATQIALLKKYQLGIVA